MPVAEQAAEKLRMYSERVKIGGYKTINQPSRIVPIAPAQNECNVFPSLSLEKGTKTVHGVSMSQGRINRGILARSIFRSF
jgi:hypothetical protein